MSKKIKVLFVLNHMQFADGVATTLRSLVQNINKDKFELHILPLYKHDSEFTRPIEDMAKIHKGIGFYFKGLSTIVSKIPLKWMYSLFVREHFDVEVAYQFGMATKIISASTNPNKICWMHGFDTDMVLRHFYEKYAKIISVSQIGSKKLKQAGFENSDFCYNIIDEVNINKKSIEQIPFSKSKKYLIVTICRLSPEKALLREIKSIQKANEKDSLFELWIIGDGPEKESLNQYIESNNISDSVKLLGQQTNPFKFLKEADIYLCGSLHEGFNTSCQEAGIMGVPVVSTDVDGAQELIEILGCGKVVPNSEEAILSILSEIRDNPSLIEKWKSTAINNKSNLYKSTRIKKIEDTLNNIKLIH